MAEFNSYASPKVETKRFKIYADVSESGLAPEWELQGRGVESWTVEENQDVEKTTDVLGYVDMERGTAQPTQVIHALNLCLLWLWHWQSDILPLLTHGKPIYMCTLVKTHGIMYLNLCI